jgi:hypothetical protein
MTVNSEGSPVPACGVRDGGYVTETAFGKIHRFSEVYADSVPVAKTGPSPRRSHPATETSDSYTMRHRP